MKLLAIGTGLSWVLLGASVGTDLNIVQYGALGLLAFVVVWACLRGFPALVRAQKDEVGDLKEAIDRLATEIRVLKERIPPKS